jgi:hypothetical protein
VSNIIRIKRSGVSGNPSTLAAGELAYSAADASSVQGGDRLYIGFGSETNGNAAQHIVIGGEFFTSMLDHAKGTLTADSALIVDSNKKINELNVDNVSIVGNTILTSDIDGDLILAPNGTGQVSIGGAYKLPASDGSAGQFITTDGSGNLSFDSITTSFDISGDSGSDSFTTGETLNFLGSGAVSTAVTDNNVAISVVNAGTSTKGVASFDSSDFSVSSGAVSIDTGAVDNTQLANSDVTIGATIVSLGGTQTALTGLTQVDVDNLTINGNAITSTDTDGDVVLDPNGAGAVSVSNSRIADLENPVDPQDAATKAYVDARAAGLDPKASVRAATTTSVDLTTDLTNGNTVDGVTLATDDRVLVKDQTNASENGVYVVVSSGTASRAADFDEPEEVTSGVFFFIEEGSTNADAGFVLTSTGGQQTVGTDDLDFVQFSGAGQIIAGDGISKSGNTLSVNTSNGIEISGDQVQLASSVAGDGLSYSSGVLNIGGTTDRITVDGNSVDIASTYVGQTSITTLGAITTGTWNGDAIGSTFGGTGLTTYSKGDLIYASASNTLARRAAGATGTVLQINATGEPVWGDIDGGTY